MKDSVKTGTRKLLSFIIAFMLAFSCMIVPDHGHFSAKTVQTEAAAAKLNKKTLHLTFDGEESTNTYKLKVKNASGKYKWSSSDTKVAKVTTKKGKSTKVVGVSAGTAVITAKRGSKTLKCTVYVKSDADLDEDHDGETISEGDLPTPVPEPTDAPKPTDIPYKEPPLYKITTDNKAVYDLPVGYSCQLEISGKKAKRFYVHTGDDKYVSVSTDGSVTGLKETKTAVSVFVETTDYNNYWCKINVTASGDGTEPTNVPTQKVTEAPTAAPTPTVTAAPTSVPTQAPVITSTPTPTQGADKDKQGTPKTLEEDLAGDTYGLLYPKKREAYVGRKSYKITDEKSLVLAVSDGLEKGIRGIVLQYDTNNWQYWESLYEKNKNCSEFGSCVRDGVLIDYAVKGELSIYPPFKYADQAITYYRYKEPEIDSDTMKLLEAAYKLAQEAVAAHPGDVKAILLYANDKICEMTEYTKPVPKGLGVPERDATGVFFNGSAVCAGYTSAYKMVLDILGVENDILVNDEKPEENAYHCWNHVKVDGKWYHIDVTWNDYEGSMKDRMFMLTDEELKKECEYRGDTSAHKWNAKFKNY
ncbi:MAG: hypothetical protein J5824_01580 [Lachnospiraceae bacterium]|nr:hypothetical protein [Lachnospiraceae bacterium]